jgi:hypothetical protein
MKKYSVLVTEDYDGNRGDSIHESFDFESLQQAKDEFAKQCKGDYSENGKYCTVELQELTIDEEDYMSDPEVLESFRKPSKAIPDGSIIVTFHHVQYMHYCYAVTHVREAFGDTHENLNVSVDNTNRPWDAVFSSLEEMTLAFENKSGMPFNKLNSGSKIVTEFIESQYDYDVVFNCSHNTMSKGFAYQYDKAVDYIDSNNGSNESYFADFKGGTASIVCNQTGIAVFQTEVI